MARISDRIRDTEKTQPVTQVKYHIIPTEDGDWRVKRTGAERADSIHETKDKAVDRARDLAKQLTVAQVIIHKKDGSIEAERTYRKDRLI